MSEVLSIEHSIAMIKKTGVSASAANAEFEFAAEKSAKKFDLRKDQVAK